tara:strand:- start:92 stop:610 length:519 start_codon:yes stop_codon:yes gene_type:complete
MITMMVACNSAGVIGISGSSKRLWHSSVDMKFFKENTENNTILMGHNTFKDLGRFPDRNNVVLSRTVVPGFREGVYYIDDYKAVLELEVDVFVIGGKEVFNKFYPIVDQVILTQLAVGLSEVPDYDLFDLDRLENEFVLGYESNILVDMDKVSGKRIELCFTKWSRRQGVLN